MGIYMKVSGTTDVGAQSQLTFGSVTSSYVNSMGITTISSPDYIPASSSIVTASIVLQSGTPIDAVCFTGKSGSEWRTKWWIGQPKLGTYTLVHDRLIIQTSFTGTLQFDYIDFNDETDFAFSENTSPSWMRLYGWEVISSASAADPYGLLRGTGSALLSSSVTPLRLIGDDFSSYANKSAFTASVGIVGGVNPRDQGSPNIPNLNYQGAGIYGGFFDEGLNNVSGSLFVFSSIQAYLPWRFVSSSTNSSGTTEPFGGMSIWQLCNRNGTKLTPATLSMYISGSWNTGSVRGYPTLGIFEYTNSVSQSTWQLNASGGLIRYWSSYPGSSTDISDMSMSLRSMLDATFYAPIPSGAYGASETYTNYGFYPSNPVDLSASILDVL
jgi:hypothetical protein